MFKFCQRICGYWLCFSTSVKAENFISFKLEVFLKTWMMETCLLIPRFLKGLNFCMKGWSPPPILAVLVMQVKLLTHSPPGSIFIEFLLWTWCPVCFSSCRPPCGPATNHRKPDGPGGADVLWDVDPTFLSDCASVLGGSAAGAAAAPPPAAPPPAASWRCSPAHTHLEASEWQVAF